MQKPYKSDSDLRIFIQSSVGIEQKSILLHRTQLTVAVMAFTKGLIAIVLIVFAIYLAEGAHTSTTSPSTEESASSTADSGVPAARKKPVLAPIDTKMASAHSSGRSGEFVSSPLDMDEMEPAGKLKNYSI